MGLFGSSSKYSTNEHHLSSTEIKQLLWDHLSSIKPEHKTIAIEAIREKRGNDKEVSLEQIYRVLLDLERRQEISQNDREEIMELFVGYFTEHFK